MFKYLVIISVTEIASYSDNLVLYKNEQPICEKKARIISISEACVVRMDYNMSAAFPVRFEKIIYHEESRLKEKDDAELSHKGINYEHCVNYKVAYRNDSLGSFCIKSSNKRPSLIARFNLGTVIVEDFYRFDSILIGPNPVKSSVIHQAISVKITAGPAKDLRIESVHGNYCHQDCLRICFLLELVSDSRSTVAWEQPTKCVNSRALWYEWNFKLVLAYESHGVHKSNAFTINYNWFNPETDPGVLKLDATAH